LIDVCQIWKIPIIIHVIPYDDSILSLLPFANYPNSSREYNINEFPLNSGFGIDGIQFRGLKVLPQKSAITALNPQMQLALLKNFPHMKISHSFFGNCGIGQKLVMLPNGREVHCSANKCNDLGQIARRCDLFFN